MLDTMPHRGPDGTGVWCEGRVGLGHALLCTTPESKYERYPVRAVGDARVLTAEVRLDNRDEVARHVGVRPSEHVPDGQLLLTAWQRWGSEAVHHLLGDFAVACWDSREQVLQLATDHLGVRPLYYVYHPHRLFAFASEMKALLALPEVPDELDEEAIVEFFIPELLSVERTLYRHIRRMPPAHLLTVTSGGMTLRRYWTLEQHPQPRRSDEDYVEEFRALFDEAVRCRLRSVGPVGSELSGGLDSSYVTCRAHDLLAEQGRLPLHTFSTVYDVVRESDERPFIHTVTQAFSGLVPHEEGVDACRLEDLLDEIFAVYDSGLVAGNHYLNWITARAAGRHGVRVLLTGQDGDSTVSHGLEWFSELVRGGDWRRFAREAHQYTARVRGEAATYATQQPASITAGGVFGHFALPYLRMWYAAGRYGRVMRGVWAAWRYFDISVSRLLKSLRLDEDPWAERYTIPAYLQDEILEKYQVQARLEAHRREQVQMRCEATVRGEQVRRFATPYVVHTLETLAQYGAAHGVEVRHPFMDKRLISYCVNLPPDLSLRDGWTRWILRRAMRSVVPGRIVERVGKTALGPQHTYLVRAHIRRGKGAISEEDGNASRLAGLLRWPYLVRVGQEVDGVSDQELARCAKALNLIFWASKTQSMA